MIKFKIRKNDNDMDKRWFIFTELIGYYVFSFGIRKRYTIQIKKLSFSDGIKFLFGFFVALFLTATLGICRADSQLKQASDELYLCNYVGHQTETKKATGLVYFECYYSLDDDSIITTEYKTLVVFSKDEMFVVGGWVR